MILAFDIGNSNINLCFMEDRAVIKQFRISSDIQKTPDEYAASIFALIELSKINPKELEAALISSVVPALTPIVGDIVRDHLRIEPIIVTVDSDLGLNVKVDYPYELGIDRVMGTLAAYTQFKRNCIVANFGTATTFDVVSKNGDFLGGVIFPGIRLSALVLHTGTALLPQVDIKKPLYTVGTSTIKCIQSGLFYGFLELADGLITRIIDEKFHEEGAALIFTGGMGREISAASRHNPHYQPSLIPLGLYVVYERIVKKKYS
jgi:type III pantothenate kinase